MISAAVVRFRPVFSQYFLNLERDHGSGSTICPNLGPDHSERFEMVRFWFRTGSNLRTSQKYYLFFKYSRLHGCANYLFNPQQGPFQMRREFVWHVPEEEIRVQGPDCGSTIHKAKTRPSILVSAT
jgi:hypothetical protein